MAVTWDAGASQKMGPPPQEDGKVRGPLALISAASTPTQPTTNTFPFASAQTAGFLQFGYSPASFSLRMTRRP